MYLPHYVNSNKWVIYFKEQANQKDNAVKEANEKEDERNEIKKISEMLSTISTCPECSKKLKPAENIEKKLARSNRFRESFESTEDIN
jgi:transposase